MNVATCSVQLDSPVHDRSISGVSGFGEIFVNQALVTYSSTNSLPVHRC